MPLYLTLIRMALGVAVQAILPIILVLLAVGVVTSTLQAIVQMEDTALSLLPKTIAMIIIAVLGGFGAFDLIRTLAVAWITHATMLMHQQWS